jgi:hypothetical protein
LNALLWDRHLSQLQKRGADQAVLAKKNPKNILGVLTQFIYTKTE